MVVVSIPVDVDTQRSFPGELRNWYMQLYTVNNSCVATSLMYWGVPYSWVIDGVISFLYISIMPFFFLFEGRGWGQG